LGFLGISLTLITALISSYFFRTYSFNETRLLCRRFDLVLVIQILASFLTTFTYYLNIASILPFKTFLAQVAGLSRIYDIFWNNPFQNRTIINFFMYSVFFYYISMSATAIWLFTEIEDTQLFYFMVLSALFIYSIGQ
jgi:hypothetical protein